LQFVLEIEAVKIRLQPTFKAMGWYSMNLSPERQPIEKQKMKIKQKADFYSSARNYC